VRVSGESDRTRFGLVAGKRVGKAVARNRARRRLRHVIGEVSLEPATDYVFIAGPEVLTADFSTLRRWLESAIGGDSDA
jgi:ribonuclease P protein component